MRYSEPIEPEAAVQFQQEDVPGKTSFRERLLSAEGLQAYRHTLRQARPELPRVDLSWPQVATATRGRGLKQLLAATMVVNPEPCATLSVVISHRNTT